MPVGLVDPEDLLPVKGVELAVAASGMRYQGRDDLLLISLTEETNTATVFTTNRFCAAPVVVAKEHFSQTQPRVLAINAGNANAGTGEQGVKDSIHSCELIAKQFNIKKEQVLPFSTGVIGMSMDMQAYESGVNAAAQLLGKSDWLQAAKAIMTTDVVAKAKSKELVLDGKKVTLTGIAKGSGMICPNMATMLSYIVTDASIDQDVLQLMLRNAANASFNRITVDGDTSTNDALTISATGKAGNNRITDSQSAEAQLFYEALLEVVTLLAQAIVRDGEGATKFVEINVVGSNDKDCQTIAYTVAHSPLVKTALFASDPNWGRLLAAVGRAPVSSLDISLVSIRVNDVLIIDKGEPASSYTEEQGQDAFNQSDINIHIAIGKGAGHSVIWTCDFSHEYISINADYRS